MSPIQRTVENCKHSVNASFDWIIPDFVTWSKNCVKGEIQSGPIFYFEKNVTFLLKFKFDSEINENESSGSGQDTDGDENVPLKMSVELRILLPFYKRVNIKQLAIGLVDHTGRKETKYTVRKNTYFDPNPDPDESTTVVRPKPVSNDAEFSSQQISDFLSDDGHLRIRYRIETKEHEFENEPTLVKNLAKNWDTGDFSDAILVRFRAVLYDDTKLLINNWKVNTVGI